jgi:hypothetical protein
VKDVYACAVRVPMAFMGYFAVAALAGSLRIMLS